ncbi:MAG: GAF domain-containing sensor histidine kinase, partial [Dehalococcoidales bacterium]|nr:GAF domain-containing sensor histidine kinase [Dehalococcoidales bacterium]
MTVEKLRVEGEHRYKILYAIAKELTSSLVADEVLNYIVESITRAMGVKGCSLLLLTPDKEQLIHSISYGLSNWYLKKGPVSANTIFPEILEGKPVAILDASQDPRIQYREEARREGIASTLSVPLMPRGEVIGVMRVYTSEPRQFSSEDIDFLSALANLGAIALEKAKLYESLGQSLEKCSIERSGLEEEKNRFLRFLAIAAHDLKAPLTAIQGYFWVMLGGFSGELNDKQKHMLQRSSQRVSELLELISDLLDIPRIEAGRIADEMVDVSLVQVIKRALDDLQSSAKQKEVKLKAKLPQSLPKIHGSVPHLQRVVSELLTNAINYSPGGMVTIMVKEEDDDIRVEVTDNGIGIP